MTVSILIYFKIKFISVMAKLNFLQPLLQFLVSNETKLKKTFLYHSWKKNHQNAVFTVSLDQFNAFLPNKVLISLRKKSYCP